MHLSLAHLAAGSFLLICSRRLPASFGIGSCGILQQLKRASACLPSVVITICTLDCDLETRAACQCMVLLLKSATLQQHAEWLVLQ
jgi:hypothetical protein